MRASEHDRPDIAAARAQWAATAPTLDPTRLVFLDETGVATNLLRRYGRGPRGQRVADHAPQGRWERVPREPTHERIRDRVVIVMALMSLAFGDTRRVPGRDAFGKPAAEKPGK